MPPSKTARRSSPSLGKALTPEQLADNAASAVTRRIIPCAGGRYCYIMTIPSGQKHLATDSAEFDALVAEQAGQSEAYANRLRSELLTLCDEYPGSQWPVVAARLMDADGPLADSTIEEGELQAV